MNRANRSETPQNDTAEQDTTTYMDEKDKDMKNLDALGLRFLLLLLALAVGCSSGDSPSDTGDTPGTAGATGIDDDAAAAGNEADPDAAPAPSLLLGAKPEGAVPLASVKESAKKGDRVVFEARIGGRGKPFVDNRAIMVVIDPSLPSCADNEGDTCAVPWDYCCETPETLVANTASVQWVGEDGRPRSFSLENRGGLEALDWITVVGEVSMKDESGLFVVNATGVFLDKKG